MALHGCSSAQQYKDEMADLLAMDGLILIAQKR
jgi:hypothetical protein